MTLSDLASLLRAAVQCGDYAQAESLMADWRRVFDDTWSGMTPAERGESRLPAEALELLNHLRKASMTGRAILAEKAAALQPSPYGSTGSTKRQTWQLEG